MAGCLGETSAILIVLGGLFIIWKKAANWRIVVSEVAAFAVLQAIFWLAGVRHAADPLTALLAGARSWACSSWPPTRCPPRRRRAAGGSTAHWSGALTVLIRTFSIWPEGTMFAILLGNTFAPIVDWLIRQRQQKRKTATAADAAEAPPAPPVGGRA